MVHRIWFVGFAGHRVVEDPVGVKAVLHHEIRDLASQLNGEIVGISSAASGADLIFLEACRELGVKTAVILPFPPQRFARDFEDAAEWERARGLIEEAWWSEVVQGNEEAPAAYHRVSRELLELAERMIFFWDGKPSRGVGGTGESVDEAREWGLPSRLIDASTLERTWLAGSAPDPVTDEVFADLPKAMSIPSLFEQLDRRATASAPKSRWFTAGSVSVNSAAVFLQASLLAMGLARDLSGFFRFSLVLLAALLPWVGSRLRLQERWYSDRIRAELLRSLLATHGLGSPLRPPALELFTKDVGFIRSVSMLLVAERQDWETVRNHYLSSRLDHQIRYLRAQGALASGRMRWYRQFFTLCSGGAIAAAAAVVFSFLLEIPADTPSKRWALGFLPVALPGLAAWSLAMMAVFEFKRRSALYTQMVEELERFRPKIAEARCASAAAAAARQCERLLLNELWEWQGARRK